MSTKQPKNNSMDQLAESFERQFSHSDLELMDILKIPSQGDRMIRLRTVEDALENFDGGDEASLSYLVRVRKRLVPVSPAAQEFSTEPNWNDHSMSPSAENAELPESNLDINSMVEETLTQPTDEVEQIYLPTGKLNVPFLMKNAQLLFDAGEFADAITVLGRVYETGEDSSSALYLIGKCHEKGDNRAEAEKAFRHALSFRATQEIYETLTNLLVREKRDQEAAELLDRALQQKDLSIASQAELLKAAGNCWLRAEKPEKAITSYQNAITLTPTNDDIYGNLGALYLRLGKLNDAKKHFSEAARINSRNAKALTGLGSCAIAENDKKAAHDFFAKSLSLRILNPPAIYHIVKCAYELKSYSTAARLLEEYIESAPINTHLLYSLAGLQYHLGRLEEARDTVDRILGMQPHYQAAVELKILIDKVSN